MKKLKIILDDCKERDDEWSVFIDVILLPERLKNLLKERIKQRIIISQMFYQSFQ